MTVPLTRWEDGSLRITGTRVPLETILYHFKLGAVPEQIVYMFEGLRLTDIYGVVAYYLSNQVAVEAYLREREAKEDAVLARLEADSNYQQEKHEFRERLMTRWEALQP